MARRGRPPSDEELVAAAVRLGDRMRANRMQMASAESCTGGMVGHIITQVPHASDHYVGGIVSYSDAVNGIGGPDGGSEEKPVGLVYVAALRRGREAARIERRVWPHDRDGNKR